MRFWWVNHNQTWEQEIGRGYLWSPRREAKARSRFYDNMRIATRGDLVFSYARQRVGHLGVVTDDAINAPKPAEFGSTGAYWSHEGWMLPVAWRTVPFPISPRSVWTDLQPLLPSKYSPLDRNGDGSQKAYFAEIGLDAFNIIQTACGVAARPETAAFPPRFDIIEEDLDHIIETRIALDADIGVTEREQLVQARRGQGVFRERVSALEPSCRLTGINNPTLLIASHIKPWRSCTSAAERLDANNGLLLTPSADRLFDRGLITFREDGSLVISPRLPADDRRRLRLEESEAPRAFTPGQLAYLRHHSEVTFLA